MRQWLLTTIFLFQSTPPARGATYDPASHIGHSKISIHAPREGGNFSHRLARRRGRYFNPRPPRGGRLRVAHLFPLEYSISIHAPREGGDEYIRWGYDFIDISIHAPREGGDCSVDYLLGLTDISIHAPREGGDADAIFLLYLEDPISIHAPREGGDLGDGHSDRHHPISIHAPREGGDFPVAVSDDGCIPFQSTPPARGATKCRNVYRLDSIISIHAPREGGDGGCAEVDILPLISIHAPREGGDTGELLGERVIQYFNPRPPRGGRLLTRGDRAFRRVFQSTPPARGATVVPLLIVVVQQHFNPRPPRGGRSAHHRAGEAQDQYFNPRPPRGGRPARRPSHFSHRHISIHAPREGGDVRLCVRNHADARNFNPRPPRGGRQQRCTVLPVDL